MQDSIEIRAADSPDVEAVIRLNPAASERAERAALIRESVDAGRAFVAVWRGTVVGYAVLEHFEVLEPEICDGPPSLRGIDVDSDVVRLGANRWLTLLAGALRRRLRTNGDGQGGGRHHARPQNEGKDRHVGESPGRQGGLAGWSECKPPAIRTRRLI